MSRIVKMQRRYGWEWYLENDEGDVAWVAPMVKEHIERLEAENAELREELESVGMAAYLYGLYGRGDLRAENAKLRKLASEAHSCKTNDGCCEDCYCDEGCCPIERRMQELGVEVN